MTRLTPAIIEKNNLSDLPDIDFCKNCADQILVWTIVANVIILLLKSIGVFFSHSAGLFADMLQSFACIISSVILLYSIKVAKRERNDRYPYGYGMIEFIASTVVFSLLLGLGAFIIIENIALITMGDGTMPGIIGLPIALIVTLVTFMMYKYNSCAGQRLDSAALTSNGKQVLCDTYSSFGVAVGILLAQLGPNFVIADKLAAIFVGFLILKDSFENWRINMDVILHKVPKTDYKKKIKTIVSKSNQGLMPHTIKIKRVGKKYWMGIGLNFSDKKSVGDMLSTTNKIRESLHREVEWLNEVEFFLDRPVRIRTDKHTNKKTAKMKQHD